MEQTKTTLEWALFYASKGWAVFPCNIVKEPLTEHGFYDATTDPKKVTEFFTKYPHANIGIATGKVSGFFGLDIDVKKGQIGDQSLAKLEAEFGKLQHTLSEITWSGGEQYYFKYPKGGMPNLSYEDMRPGIEIKGDGGYVIVAPSRYKGELGEGEYHWKVNARPENTEIANAPEWLLNIASSAILAKKKKAKSLNFHSGETESDNINIIDVLLKAEIPMRQKGKELVGSHPKHGSTTGGNLNVNLEKNVWICRRHNTGGGPLSFIAVLEGIIDCSEAVPDGLKGKKYIETCQVAGDKYGFDVKIKPRSQAETLLSDELFKQEDIPNSLSDYRKVEKTCEILSMKSEFFRDLDGRVVRVNERRGCMEEVDQAMMITEISKFIRFVKKTKKGEEWIESEAKVSKLFAEQVLSAQSLNLQILESITNIPRFSRNGTLCDTEGYNIEDKSYYIKTFNIPEINIEDSMLIIDEFLHDFAFSDGGIGKDKTNILSLMFAPTLSKIIQNFPLHAVSSNQARTGKSLLVESILLIYNYIGATNWPQDNAELNKKVTAILLKGLMFVYFDNIKHKIENSSIECCLTTGVYKDRVLGRSEMVSIPSHAVWVVTGNNIEFGLEMMKRAVCTELNAHTEAPEYRKDFKHQDIKSWVVNNREKLLGAIYSIIKAWIAAGMKKGNTRLGGFEKYAAYMGGLLEFLGRKGFLESPNDSIEDVDMTFELRFLEMWAEKLTEINHGREYCLAGDLVSIAEKAEFPFDKTDDKLKAQRLGYKLKNMSNKTYKDYAVKRLPGQNDGTRYFLTSK